MCAEDRPAAARRSGAQPESAEQRLLALLWLWRGATGAILRDGEPAVRGWSGARGVCDEIKKMKDEDRYDDNNDDDVNYADKD